MRVSNSTEINAAEDQNKRGVCSPQRSEAPTRRELLNGGAGIALAPLLGSCGLLGETHSIRYRLKLVFERAGIIYEGASVIEAIWRDLRGSAASAGSGQGFGFSAKAEAPVVDIEDFGSIFALVIRTGLPSSPTESVPFDVGYPCSLVFRVIGAQYPAEYAAAMHDAEAQNSLLRLIKSYPDETAVPNEWLPTMVRFANPLNPMSVSLVDPFDMDLTFGHKVTFLKATVQIVRSSLTRGEVVKRLPWLEGRKDWLTLDNKISRQTNNLSLANKITSECFIRKV